MKQPAAQPAPTREADKELKLTRVPLRICLKMKSQAAAQGLTLGEYLTQLIDSKE